MDVVLEEFRQGAWYLVCVLDEVCAAEELAEQLSQRGHRCRVRFGPLDYRPGRGWGTPHPPRRLWVPRRKRR